MHCGFISDLCVEYSTWTCKIIYSGLIQENGAETSIRKMLFAAFEYVEFSRMSKQALSRAV